MSKFHVIATLRLAWWVRPYLCALQFFAQLTGLEPDVETAADLIVRRGMKIKHSPMMRTED